MRLILLLPIHRPFYLSQSQKPISVNAYQVAVEWRIISFKLLAKSAQGSAFELTNFAAA